MKGKLLTTAILATLLVGSNAMASIARQAVLGNQPVFGTTGATVVSNTVNGSLWYDDDYNVFYNPSYVNDNKNYVTIQKGLEGGFFKGEFENFAYGVYLNRGGANGANTGPGNAGNLGQYATGLVAPGYAPRGTIIGTARTALTTQRPIDLFFGGDTGIKWGFHVAWAYNRTQDVGSKPDNGDAEITNRYWHFDLGAQVMGFEPFLGVTMAKYDNTTTPQLGSSNLDEFQGGFRYKYEGWTPYFVYKKWKESGTPLIPAVFVPVGSQVSTRFHTFGIGFGHDTKVADGVHVLKHVGAYLNTVEDDTAAAGAATVGGGQAQPDLNKDFKDYVIPVNIALEAEATSWLTLRAGASYDFINTRKFVSSNKAANASPATLENKQVSQAGNTRFRIGSTLKFGKLHIDSAFGNGAAAATGAETLDSGAMGFDGQTFAQVSASYHW